MSLESWVEYGWLKPHKTSAQEVRNLFDIVKRDLEDAGKKRPFDRLALWNRL